MMKLRPYLYFIAGTLLLLAAGLRIRDNEYTIGTGFFALPGLFMLGRGIYFLRQHRNGVQ